MVDEEDDFRGERAVVAALSLAVMPIVGIKLYLNVELSKRFSILKFEHTMNKL